MSRVRLVLNRLLRRYWQLVREPVDDQSEDEQIRWAL